MTRVMQENRRKGIDFIIISITGDGYDLKQKVHKKYTMENGEVNEGILYIIHKIHFDKANIEHKFKRITSELRQGVNRELAAEIHTHDAVNLGWIKKLKRLNELLVLIENGKFSVRCTLEECPDHSANNGICHCGEDLTEALRHFPEFVGCAKGRQLLDIDAKKYGEVVVCDTSVSVIRRHSRKK